MRCIVCYSQISKNNVSDLCAQCKFDKNMFISTTDAKKIYRLTNEEITDANLFSIGIYNHWCCGFRFFIDDIEELAEMVFASISNSDKRKCIYLKNIVDINDNYGIEKKLKIESMTRLAYEYFDIHNIILDDDLILMVDKYIKKNYDKDVNIIINIVKRKNKIDKMINEQITIRYIEKSKTYDIYKSYVYGDIEITNVIDKIKIYNRMSILTRKINKMLKDNIPSININNIQHHKSYKAYINGKIILDLAVKHIRIYLIRLNKLNKFISTNIDGKYRGYIILLPIYKKYIFGLRNDNFEEICISILENVKEKSNRDNRIIIFNTKYASWLKYIIHNNPMNLIYEKYINHGGDIDKVITKILNLISQVSPCKLNNIQLAFQKYSHFNIDQAYLNNVQFNYLCGNIKLYEATNMLKSYDYLIINCVSL